MRGPRARVAVDLDGATSPCRHRGRLCRRTLRPGKGEPAMGLFNGNFGNGDFLLTMLEFFLFVIWFWLLLAIFADLFRDRDASGWAKALWVVFVVVLPYVGVFVYLIARGRGMAARSQEQAQAAQDSLDARIRSAAGTSTSPS